MKLSRDGPVVCRLVGLADCAARLDESTLPPPDRAADGIGVVDLATHTLVRTYPSGRIRVVDLSLDGKTLYVSNEETAEMSVLDLATGTIVARVRWRGARRRDRAARRPRRLRHVRSRSTVVGIDTSTRAVIARVPTQASTLDRLHTRWATMFVTGENGMPCRWWMSPRTP